MLKSIRVTLAILSILAVTLLFVDFTGAARDLWPWMAKIQFMPAVFSANIAAILFVLVLTLLLGRVYCSVICPLGIMQDVVNWLRGHTGKRKKRINRFRFVKAHTRVRLIFLTVFVALAVIGLLHGLAASIAGVLEPYSDYGLIASQIFAPICEGINNLLAKWSESQVDNYTFARVAMAVSIPLLALAIVLLIVFTTFAWRGGRDYCNTVCPVGTILGYLSKFSLFKLVINTDACINCGKCGRNCKAKCIDTKQHQIDYTRCVVCMDCVETCTEGAITYKFRPFNTKDQHKPEVVSQGRRGFVSGAGFLAGALAMETLAKTTDGGLTALKDKVPAKRATKVVPAGAQSISHLQRLCTGCQLCIRSCPNHVLKPSLSIDSFMQPVIDYTDGFCDPSCTVCSNLCPQGALHPVDVVAKSSIKVGTAVVDLESCISAQGHKCGNCASHCPAGAIIMMQTDENDKDSPRIPIVNDHMCIGCGKCEYYCPAGTVADMASTGSAIHVEGLEMHRTI